MAISIAQRLVAMESALADAIHRANGAQVVFRPPFLGVTESDVRFAADRHRYRVTGVELIDGANAYVMEMDWRQAS